MSAGTQGKANGRSREVAALLEAAHAVLENRGVVDTARAISAACRTILGAESGLVAVSAEDGEGLEVVFLDSGNPDLDPAAPLPAPLRQLSARAVKLGQTVIANDLSKRTAKKPPPGRASAPRSALFAPILIAGEVAGLLGLIEKPEGFSAADSQLAEVFAEMAAGAMLNSRTVKGLEKNRNALERKVRRGATQLRQAEEMFKTLVESLPDVIARFDPDLRLLYVSPAIRQVTGHSPQEYVGMRSREMGWPSESTDAWDTALRTVFATGRPEKIELAYPGPDGVRHFDCRLVPEAESDGGIPSVLCVARDVTDRRLAYEAEQRARHVADSLREATVALTRSLDRETVLTTLLDRLLKMVPSDRARIMVLEEASRVSVRAIFDGERVVPLPVEERPQFDASDHPILQTILTTGSAVLIPDIRTRTDWSLPTDRSSEANWLGVPLFARGDVAGLISLSKREPGYFNEEHVKVAEALSSQASVAVENAVLFEQMQASAVRMQALSRRLVEAQENERRRIARELHDEAGQALVSLRYGLRLLEREMNEGGSGNGRVAELVQRTDAVIDGLHRLAADLRPPSLDLVGLVAALRQYSRSVASKRGLTVRFKARGFTGEHLPSAVETALYRVVQEAMTNVVRHADATRVDVLAEHRGDRVMVMVEDDGVGFEPDRAQRGDHFGLLGMRERVEALGGTLTVESAPGAGATIVVEVASADSHLDR